ncbi:MAG TPA: tetratricopeptide repeat protein [Bacillota bacterium]|nr:tetratricopeptide repeat protein [Bacillota bacterium]
MAKTPASNDREPDLDTALKNGKAAFARGDYQLAGQEFQHALEISLSLHGEKHVRTAACHHEIGFIFHQLGEYDQALSYYQDALKIGKKVIDPADPVWAAFYNNMGNTYLAKSDWNNAIYYHEQALRVWDKAPNQDPWKVAISYSNLGNAYDLKGEFAKAIIYYEKGLEILIEVAGKDHPDVATLYNNLGNVYNSKGEYHKALSYQRQAIKITEKASGLDHPEVATSYNNLGNVYYSMGKYDEAISSYEHALGIWSKASAQNHLKIATSYNNLGDAYSSKGEYDKALSYFHEALNTRNKAFGREHPEVAASYSSIAGVYLYKDEYDKAITYYEKALEILCKVLTPKPPEAATILSSIGSAYNAKKEYDKARSYFERALKLSSDILGPAHPSVALSYNNLGAVDFSKNEYDSAISNYKKALKIWVQALGKNHPRVAIAYSNLGMAYQTKGEYNKASFHHMMALMISNKALGADHPAAALYYNNLGVTFQSKGNFDKAISYYQNSLAISKKAASRQQFVNTAGNIGSLYYKKGGYAEAKGYFEEGIAAIEKFRLEMGAGKGEFTGRNIDIYRYTLKTCARMGDVAGAFQIAEMMKEKGFLDQLSLKAALNSKGIDPQDRERALQLSQSMDLIHQQLQTEIDKSESTQDKTCLGRLSDELEAVEQEFAILEEKLLQNERYQNLRRPDVISLEKARALCSDGAAILEYILWEGADPERQSYCLVITQSSLEIIELPLDFEYEATIDDLRQALINDETAFQQYLALLYGSLIKPLAESLRGIRRLIVVPDGALAKLPFDALRAETTARFLGEDYLISLSPSVSVLAMTESRRLDPARDWFLGFGGIDYGVDLEGWGQWEELSKTESAMEPVDDSARTAEMNGKNPYYQTIKRAWSNLPGTLQELQAIRNLIANPKEARIVTGAEASEAKVKEMSESLDLARHRIIHFASHGYYDPVIPSFSALVLAEVSGRLKSPEDGYLSVPEAALLHFNADMVNLSTCASGLGKLEPGDGLIGLTRAFLAAGANRAGVTLWPVQDAVAKEFMVAMYEKVYQASKSYVEAYADTKREFIRGERSEVLRSPRYWSPFVLYGM